LNWARATNTRSWYVVMRVPWLCDSARLATLRG
jgi:hypothetical protein